MATGCLKEAARTISRLEAENKSLKETIRDLQKEIDKKTSKKPAIDK